MAAAASNAARGAASSALSLSARRTMTASSHPNQAAGLGIGNVRTGLGAVHRVVVTPPKYLKAPKTCAILGAPWTYGQPYYGLDEGPSAIRAAGLHQALKKLDWRVADHGDMTFKPPQHGDPEYEGPGECREPFAVSQANGKIARRYKEHAEKGHFVMTLGGDHSIGLGTVAGAASVRPDVGVVWVDAHADINTPEGSPSGNMHGMPLSFVMGLCDPNTIPGMDWMADIPQLDPAKQLVYIGLRDLDKMERHFIHNLGIKAFTMYHVDKFGIGKVMEMAMDHVNNRPLHMSYDIDACDPMIAPSTGTAVRGGLTYREAHFVAEAVAETGQLVSLDIVEVNPKSNSDDEDMAQEGEDTTDMALALIASSMGNRIL